MAVPKFIHTAKGSWQGTSRLHLSFLPPEERITESNSSLKIETDERENFVTLTYYWYHEGQRQQGTILLCGSSENKNLQMSWVDSWHQNFAIMNLEGSDTAAQYIQAKGNYSGGDEIWGWSIRLELQGDNLILSMDNHSPNGESEWAVQASYIRD